MRNVSRAFRKLLNNDKRNYLSFADITLADDPNNPTLLELSNAEIMTNGFSCEQAVSDDDSFTALGSVIIGSATVVINNLSGDYSDYDFTNAKTVMRIGLKVSATNVETIKLGTYTVDDATYNGSSITLSLLDYMEQFDRPYATQLSYPAKLSAVLQNACQLCGVTLATQNFPHKDFYVSEPPVKEGLTFREVVSWVATLAGCFAKCNADGQLELKWFDLDALNTNDLDGGIFDPKEKYSSGVDLDGGTFLPWTTGDTKDGGNFTDYSQDDTDGGQLEANTAYPSGDAADGGKFNPWNDGYDEDGGSFTESITYHYLYDLSSQNICVDDTVITGISIVVENTTDPDPEDVGVSTYTVNGNTITVDIQESNTTYTIGSEGYIIVVEGNDFITNENVIGENEDGPLIWLGEQLIGMKFRKMSIGHLNDPTIDAGDVAKVVDRKGNDYDILITRSTFSADAYQEIVCGSETPLRNSGTRFSESTKNLLKAKKLLRKEQSIREQVTQELADALAEKAGLYMTTEPDPPVQGVSTVYYLHDMPTLAESSIVWKMTRDAFGVTTQWNAEHPEQTVWNAGLTVDGDLLTRILSAVGVDADWITTGTLRSRNGTVSIDLDNDTISINGKTSFVSPSDLSTAGGTTIDGSNITTGYIQSPYINPQNPSLGRNFTLNLSDGTLTMKKGSINIGSGAFVVDTQGNLNATSASIKGDITSEDGVKKTILDECRLRGFYKNNNNTDVSMGYLDLVASISGGYDTVFGSGADLRFEVKTGKKFSFGKTSSGYGTTPTEVSYIDTNGKYHGDVVGDVAGNVNGNVTGNVRGDVTGNVTGNVNGSLTGNVTGNVRGDVTGDVHGDVTGNLTGNVTGNVRGNLTGNVTGDITGNVHATGGLTYDNIMLQIIDQGGNVTGYLRGNIVDGIVFLH